MPFLAPIIKQSFTRRIDCEPATRFGWLKPLVSAAEESTYTNLGPHDYFIRPVDFVHLRQAGLETGVQSSTLPLLEVVNKGALWVTLRGVSLVSLGRFDKWFFKTARCFCSWTSKRDGE